MTRWSSLLTIVLLACHAGPTPQPLPADPLLSVLAYLGARAPGHAPECWSFATEPGPDYVAVDVRDKHGDTCAGDPGVEPIVDRLRVHRDGSLERYDVVRDTWLAVR